MENFIMFCKDDFEIVEMKNRSMLLLYKSEGKLVYASRKVFNELIKDGPHPITFVDKQSDCGIITWVATLLAF